MQHEALRLLDQHRVLDDTLGAHQLAAHLAGPHGLPAASQRHHPDRRRDAVGLVEQVGSTRAVDEQRRVDHPGARAGTGHAAAAGPAPAAHWRTTGRPAASDPPGGRGRERGRATGHSDAAAMLAHAAHGCGVVEQPAPPDPGHVHGPDAALARPRRSLGQDTAFALPLPVVVPGPGVGDEVAGGVADQATARGDDGGVGEVDVEHRSRNRLVRVGRGHQAQQDGEQRDDRDHDSAAHRWTLASGASSGA